MCEARMMSLGMRERVLGVLGLLRSRTMGGAVTSIRSAAQLLHRGLNCLDLLDDIRSV